MTVRRLAPWSLQRRLVVGILGLLLLVSAAVGVGSVLALHQNLLTRLDQQVGISLRAASNGPIGASGAGEGLGRRVGSIYYLVADGQGVITARYTDENGDFSTLSDAQEKVLDALTGPDDVPVTVDLGGSLGSFRVAHTAVAGTISQQPFRGTLLVGQSQSEVDTTTANLVLIFLLVTVLALLAAGAATAIIVRTALRPLARVAETATRVAELPSTRARWRSPTACPIATPIRGPRWVGSARPSTGCWDTWRTRSCRASRARTGCGSSSPTRATSCARRSRRSAATPS
ncbi:hypothetical protein GCM10025881_12610 [Pseudolysinimonas kribbensis]|uniref:histidine kinase n=1 Tax=Pseudolysinimonas kribbensis TaxID=433641 RepID=A0ABQ6K1G1_9MICO|nr:hypothetical protein [Pseudolysinimonas kribbensis]GMA94437.1 hypothetical protein GCM10025881_12610 [Pseudolysinimonas kribbensis]